MKASRAPGAVQSTYVQMHQQKQREIKGGISNKVKQDKNSKNQVPSGNGSGGGILNKFKDLDDIPDFPMDENIVWGDNRSNYNGGVPAVHLTNDRRVQRDDDDFDDDDNDYGNYNHASNHVGWKNAQPSYGRGNSNDSDEEESNGYNNYGRGGYQQPQANNPPIRQNPPPLPITLQNKPNSNYNNNNRDQRKPQPAVINDVSPRSSNNHYQQSEPYMKQRSARRDDESSGEEDYNDHHYYEPQRKLNHQRNRDDDDDEVDVRKVPVPQKKATSLSPNRKLNSKNQPAISFADNGHAPPPLPYENQIQSPPKVIPENEKLFFSKERRNVEYKPYTLKQYKMIKPKEYVEIGNIKPDLNTEELVEKRKKLEKIKEFSKNLRYVNKESILQQPKLPSATEQADLMISKKKYESNRIRAMEYAKHIPKPKNSQSEGKSNGNDDDDEEESDRLRSREGGGGGGGGYLYMDEDAFQSAKLQELEAKHQQGKARLEAIKKSISQK